MEKKRRRRVAIASSSNYKESRQIYAKSLEVWHNLHKEEVAQISATITVEIKTEKLPKKAFVKCFKNLLEITLTKAKELEDTGIPVIYKY